jgi:hypothetical protein
MHKKGFDFKLYFLIFTVSIIFLFSLISVNAAVYRIGDSQQYKNPNEVQGVLADGDTVEIEAGNYNDITVWTKNNIIIKGVGSRPHFSANGVNIPNQKAIWVIQGDNCIVDNIEFSGADVSSNNGAGIRSEGINLTVNNSYFHDNEMGILTANDERSTIIIENTEFHDHGKSNGGMSHNIYIGQCEKFILKNSYSHHAWHGHNVKSRAENNYILYNRIMDEETGSSSYLLDLPEGGRSYVIGNLFHKGVNAENPNAAISYASENLNGEFQELYVSGNTFVNERSNGGGIRYVNGDPKLKIVNNIFLDFTSPMNSDATAQEYYNNIESTSSSELNFEDLNNFDYSLDENSIAIDIGVNLGIEEGFDLTPKFEYNFPNDLTKRDTNQELDIGALESNHNVNPTDSWKFVVSGDTRTGHDDHRKVIASIIEKVPNNERVLVMNTGDVTSSGTTSQWATWADIVEPLNVDWAKQDPPQYIGTFGNHDDGDGLDVCIPRWKENLPAQIGVSAYSDIDASDEGLYGSVIYENAIFIWVDSTNTPNGQEDFLENTLISASQDSTLDWKFVGFHHPPIPCGSKSDWTLGKTWHDDYFIPYEVDAVFLGHAHYYERTCAIIDAADKDCDENNRGNSLLNPQGPIHVIAGGGGAECYPPGCTEQCSDCPWLEIGAAKHHFVGIEIEGRKLIAKVWNTDEDELEILDSFEIIKGNINRPDTPANLEADSIENTQISLDWITVSNVDGYKVYRDGLVVAEITSSEYIDTGLEQGTDYSYQVTSIKDGIESIRSSPIIISTTNCISKSELVTSINGWLSGSLTSLELINHINLFKSC